ncbi:MAG: hypothetical protein GXX90_05465, partial [Microbacteriaceae bacterium]|nr:hypothetical protein [Microbacteriaceae bacterium]
MAELNADARRVRELCERMGALAVAGDPRWRRLLAKARRIADRIDEPFSRDDAASRLGLLASRAAIVDGDAAAAADHLRAALAAVDRQRGRVGADGQRRLDDHEWTMRFNLAQLRQALDELPAAERELARCDALAPSADDPAARTRATLVQRAAGELGAQRLPEAMAAYGDAVARFRREAPAQLGVPLLGLAQARLLAGAFD